MKKENLKKKVDVEYNCPRIFRGCQAELVVAFNRD